MEEEEQEHIPEYTDIPPIFQSYLTGTYFDRCIACNKNLLEVGTQYLIEKAINRANAFKVENVVFEYAICFDCTMDMQGKMSKESNEKIGEYFHSKVDLIHRREAYLAAGKFDPMEWIDTCLVSHEPVENLSEFQIYAHCEGPHLLFSVMPYMISGSVLEHLSGMLSKQTKDEMDGFVDEHFGGPPEFRELLKDKDVIVF